MAPFKSSKPKDPETPVTIAVFPNELVAHAARSKLESEGIEAMVADDAIIRMNWLWAQAIGGVKLRVRAKDEDRARAVLAEDHSNEKPEENQDDPAEG